MTKPLMSKATAVWLVDNTTLSFRQIAEFCGLHELEVQGIADGDVATGVKGFDPVANNQLDPVEIEKGQADVLYKLKLKFIASAVGEEKRRGPRYTPLSKRQDRPAAILWLVKFHPELSDGAVGKLVGMVSGHAETITGLMPVFQAWGEKVVRAGSTAGAAQTMKVTNNVLCGVTLMATAEAMALSARAGIPDEAMLDIINNATGRSFASSNIFPDHVLTGKFDYGATLGILFKDVDLAVKQGEELGIPMWVCQAARLVLKHAMFQGFGNQDMARARDVIEAAAAPAVAH